MENTGFKKNQDVVSSVLMDGELVLLNAETGDYFVLDKVAAHIWELLDNSTTFEEIVKKIISKYEVSFDQAEDDVRSFLNELQSNRIIETSA